MKSEEKIREFIEIQDVGHWTRVAALAALEEMRKDLAEAVEALEPFAEEWRRRREPEDDTPFAAARAIVKKHQEPR